MRHAGELIRLRPYEPGDLDAVAEYLAGWDMGGRRGIDHDRRRALSFPEISKELEGWATPEHGEVFVVTHHDVVVGHARTDVWWDAMTPWVHLVIAPGSRRRGYGSEAASLVLEHVFLDTPAHAAHTWLDDDDGAAIDFAAGLGFSECGRMRRTGIAGGRYVDTLAFELMRADWEVRHGAGR